MDPELKKIAEDVADIRKKVKGIRHYFIRQEIYSWLKITLLLLPFVIATIYLMPMIQQAIAQYQNLLNLSIDAASVKPEDVIDNISPDILKQLEALQKK